MRIRTVVMCPCRSVEVSFASMSSLFPECPEWSEEMLIDMLFEGRLEVGGLYFSILLFVLGTVS